MALSAWTSFGSDEYSLGSITSQGWTARWVTSSLTAAVISDVDAEDGRAVEYRRSGTNRKLLSWDIITADADKNEIELVARQKISGLNNSTLAGLAVRASGGIGSETGYHAHFSNPAGGVNLRLVRYVGGTEATLATATVSGFDVDTYMFLRIRCITESGDVRLKVKAWAGAVGDEPSSWTLDYLDNSVDKITSGSWAGIFSFYQTVTTDWIGVATGGGTAPTGTGGGDPEEPDLITSSDSCGLAAAGAVSVELQLDGGDVAALLAASSATSAGQLGADDAASVAGADAVQGIAAAILGAEYLKVGAAESSPLVAVMIARGDEIGAAAAEDAGVVLVRVDRTDAIALSAPTVAQVMAHLDAGDQLSLTLDEASRLIGEMVNIAASDAIGVLAGEASGISLHAHADDWLRPALLEMVGEIFSAVNASDGVTLGAIEAADLAALLRSADSAVMRSADGDPVMSVIVDASDAIVLRVSAASFVDVIMSDTGRLIGFVRLVEALGGSVELKPALGGSAALNPEAR